MNTALPGGTLAPYDALAAVYDRWTEQNDYAGWAAHLVRRFGRAELPGRAVRTVLDVCCGTGTVSRLLQDRGYEVTGVDGSAAMLEHARQRVAPGTTLLHQELPSAIPLPPASFDAAVCCFDSVNYFAPDTLAELFASVAAALRPGGVFVFDLNTRHKLETVFGDSQYGDDLGDFAYVWRNRYDAEAHACDFAISLFTAAESSYTRRIERHRQWWFAAEQVTAAAQAAGFTVTSVEDDYRDRPTGTDTLRETWTLLRTSDPVSG